MEVKKITLAEQRPELSLQWHPFKNYPLTPHDVSPGSKKKVWWMGTCSHEWESSVSNRVKGASCPVCTGKKILVGFNDLATTHPQLMQEWHPNKNISLTPESINAGSNKVVNWLGKCEHEWEAKVCHRTQDKPIGCPYCSGRSVLIGYNDLSSTFPYIAAEWHPQKNKNLTPEEVTYRTGQKVWWQDSLGHEWEASVANRTSYNSGCPICKNQKVLIGYNDFASQQPERAKKWNYTKNHPLLPTEFTQWSSKKVWWLCENNHEWEAAISGRHGCPICSGQKVLTGYNDLATIKPEIAKTWHPNLNGSLLPTAVTYGSHKNVWWICENNHEWKSFIDGRTGRGYGCPDCSSNISIAEQEIFDFIASKGLLVEPSNRKLLDGQEIDIYLPEKNLGIEFNGVYWHTEKMGKDKNYHKNKWELAKNKGIHLIQIWEDEWNSNPQLVKNLLLHKLGITDPKNKVFARKTSIHEINTTEAQNFLNKNHIQGFASASYYLGLKDQTDTLVALLALKRENVNDLNIIRYATSKTVTGGFTRLISYAEKTYLPDSFITFSDNCVSDGGLYLNNGFTADKELEPDYRYVVNGERKHKFGYRIKRFREDPNLLWGEGLTERELADLNGLDRIWDAGKIRWVKSFPRYSDFTEI